MLDKEQTKMISFSKKFVINTDSESRSDDEQSLFESSDPNSPNPRKEDKPGAFKVLMSKQFKKSIVRGISLDNKTKD